MESTSKNNNCTKLTKRERIQRKELLTADDYTIIIETVRQVHGKTLSRHMVDAYILAKKTGKSKTPIADRYQILPLVVQLTDATIASNTQKMLETAKTLQP